MKLLFKEAAYCCFKPPEERIRKLEAWVEKASQARKTGNLEAYPNQYDKAEELITFYTFAPLVLSLNKVGLTNRILGAVGVSPYEENVESIGLERLYPPPVGYLHWQKKEVKNNPVRYIREQAEAHIRANKPLEAPTHVDAFIETDKLLILFEMKFTSDISDSTTFNPRRNQLARLIDVGLETSKCNGKRILAVLSTPRQFYESRSRLYFYKMQEYLDFALIKNDIAWRPISQITDNLLAVRWLALEDLIRLLYENFNHADKEFAMEFFRERGLA